MALLADDVAVAGVVVAVLWLVGGLGWLAERWVRTVAEDADDGAAESVGGVELSPMACDNVRSSSPSLQAPLLLWSKAVKDLRLEM